MKSNVNVFKVFCGQESEVEESLASAFSRCSPRSLGAKTSLSNNVMFSLSSVESPCPPPVRSAGSDPPGIITLFKTSEPAPFASFFLSCLWKGGECVKVCYLGHFRLTELGAQRKSPEESRRPHPSFLRIQERPELFLRGDKGWEQEKWQAWPEV